MLRALTGAMTAAALWLGVPGPAPLPADAPPPACVPAATCCKVCDRGKACGNSCIARSKTCHKGRGCACDASEVCAE